jgi:hypothetical protein
MEKPTSEAPGEPEQSSLSSAALYRLYAANCLELADGTQDTDRKLFLQRLSQRWKMLADQVGRVDDQVRRVEDQVKQIIADSSAPYSPDLFATTPVAASREDDSFEKEYTILVAEAKVKSLETASSALEWEYSALVAEAKSLVVEANRLVAETKRNEQTTIYVKDEEIYGIIGTLLDKMNSDVLTMRADIAAIKKIDFGRN